MQHRYEWPNTPAAGPRRPAEACPWGVADGPMGRLCSSARLWGGPAGGRHGPSLIMSLIQNHISALKLASVCLVCGAKSKAHSNFEEEEEQEEEEEEEEGELYDKSRPRRAFGKLPPASAQKPKRKTRPAIRRGARWRPQKPILFA